MWLLMFKIVIVPPVAPIWNLLDRLNERLIMQKGSEVVKNKKKKDLDAENVRDTDTIKLNLLIS